MKASRYAASFLEALDAWEKSLSHISETVEMMMNVQRKWMYLEVQLEEESTAPHRAPRHVHVAHVVSVRACACTCTACTRMARTTCTTCAYACACTTRS